LGAVKEVRRGIRYVAQSALAAVLLLLLAEGVLRLSGVAAPPPLFVKNPLDPASQQLVVNAGFFRQFIDPQYRPIASFDGFWGATFNQTKAPDTVRIFIFGESTALSDVPDQDFGLNPMLEQMLLHAYPQLRFEIINVACFALNSHVARLAAEECSRYQPDIFLLYMGNNEYFGPWGPAWYPKGQPPASDTLNWLYQLRLLRIARAALPDILPTLPRDPLQFYRACPRMLPDQPGRQKMTQNFQDNVSAIRSSAASVGATTVVSTVAVNLRDWPPMGSAHRHPLGAKETSWNEAFAAGMTAQEAGNFEAALAHFENARKISDTFAELYFRMAQCYLKLGDTAKGLRALPQGGDAGYFPAQMHV
jgi:hypothetical protein